MRWLEGDGVGGVEECMWCGVGATAELRINKNHIIDELSFLQKTP